MVHLASRRRNGWVRVHRGGPILSEGTDVSPVSATIAVTKGVPRCETVTVWDPPSLSVQDPRTCFLNARGVLRGASVPRVLQSRNGTVVAAGGFEPSTLRV